jgi:putative hydrolase of the HAD superfamily
MKISDLKQINKNSISNIIFDWGGVITELDFSQPVKKFQELGFDNFLEYFKNSPEDNLLIDLEIGKITTEVFKKKIRKFLKDDISDEMIEDAWNSVLTVTPEPRIELIKRLGKNFNLYLFSNTNAIHVNYYNNKLRKEQNVDHSSIFKKVYYSHEFGLRKPDVRFYKSMLNDSAMQPEESLFIDDLEVNIDTAVSLGINSFHLLPEVDIVELFKDWK